MYILDFKRNLALLVLLINGLFSASCQNSLLDCTIQLKDDVLTFKNSELIIEYNWNGGEIQGRQITNLNTSHSWKLKEPGSQNPDPGPPGSADLNVYRVTGHAIYPDHLVGEITLEYDCFQMRRTFRIYPGVGALAMNLSLKKTGDPACKGEHCFDETISLPGKQWKIRSVEFLDRTDHNNNLVHSKESHVFIKPLDLRGNVLIVRDLIHNERLYIIKEAPLGENQLLYPGSDFQVRWGDLVIRNLGALYDEVENNQWFRCYGYVLGPGGKTDLEARVAIRDYMKNIRKKPEGGEEMIMMNTWGDRGQDGKISEAFIKKELQKGGELGITHLQLDDGWQQGLSKNSLTAGGQLWDQWSREDWEAHPERFPSGLGPVVEAAAGHGIALGLWFHPSDADSYSFWEQDAEIIFDLYEKWGIRTFKIDGMNLDDKNADIHMRNIFDQVTSRSNGNITFNVDATTDRRGGYFYLNEYGNIFLENRYTDWGKYYPHWTLRNLWQLTEFVPPEKLQIEFLNNTRNLHMYDEIDPLRPSVVPFDYIFATTMAGQPLAWMEASGLPEESFGINQLVESYKKVMGKFHEGYIFPIGNVPDGFSWTGFQSMTDDTSGYFLIYRENNDSGSAMIETCLPPDRNVKLEKILGYGSSFEFITGDSGEIAFRLPRKFSFGLFRYEVETVR